MKQSAGIVVQATSAGELIEIPRHFTSYEVSGVVETGGSAVVVQLRRIKTGELFAGKVMNRPIANSSHCKYVERELRLLEVLSCPNLVNVIETIYLDAIIVIVMEYCSGGDLCHMISDCMLPVATKVCGIFGEICQAVQYLHAHGVAHRDLKPENILIDETLHVKVCDYGDVCEVAGDALSSTMCGTITYAAPELLLGGKYCARKADVWSLGVILYTMLCMKVPWTADNDVRRLEEICSGRLPVENVSNVLARNVVERCCDVNPLTRATVDEILAMPYLNRGAVLLPRRSAILPIIEIPTVQYISHPGVPNANVILPSVGKRTVRVHRKQVATHYFGNVSLAQRRKSITVQ